MSTNEFEDFIREDMGFTIPRKGVYDDLGFDDEFDIECDVKFKGKASC